MMVTDLLHIDRHVPLHGGFPKALAFLRRRDLASIPDGTTEIDGRRVFAIIQRYETKKTDIVRFEYHRNYIDIQVILSGEEVIGWTLREGITETDPYNPEKDVAFGTAPRKAWTALRLGAGQLAVFFPEDAHAPCLAADDPSPVRKIVVKIGVDTLPA